MSLKKGNLDNCSSKCKSPDSSVKKKSFFKSDKKGQITIFIIIGIIILFTLAGVLYFTKTEVKDRVRTEVEPLIASVPQAFEPIRSYTESCLLDTSKRGLLILGEQGGYIYADLAGEFSVTDPTDADGLDLGSIKVPYWYYNSQPNKANQITLSTSQPKLYADEDPGMSIESQLARYVKENVGNCLNDYQIFNEQGYEVEFVNGQESKDVTATIGENTVSFLLKMKIKSKKSDTEQEMEQFYVKIPLRLKHYYEVASGIVEAQQNFTFLERQFLELLHLYSSVTPGKLPPTMAMTYDPVSTASWSVMDVKEKMESLLASYLPMLRPLDSQNFYRYQYPVTDLSNLYQTNYDNMIIPFGSGDNLEVNFDYFNWPTYFDVNSNDGTIVPQSNTIEFPGFLNFMRFSYQQYYTVYDLSYPVLVTLHDRYALDGEGYSFVFAMEANIRNNEAVSSDLQLPPPILISAETMVCNPDKYNTELIKTIVVDSFTEEPLESVQIGLSIPDVDNCLIGSTNTEGVVESKYPAVYGSIISLLKEDYLNSFYPIDTYQIKDEPSIIGYAAAVGYDSPVMKMHKLKLINVTVERKDFVKCIDNNCFSGGTGLFSQGKKVYSYRPEMLDQEHNWLFKNRAQPLKDTEQAIVMLKRVADENGRVLNNDFSASVTIKGDQMQEVQLVPGIYEMLGLLTLNEEVVIPEEERCTEGIVESIVCENPDGCCFTFDEVKLGTFMGGQLTWNEQDTYLVVTPEQLYTSEKMTFYLPNMDILGVPQEEHSRVLEDIQFMSQVGNVSNTPGIRWALEPKYE